MESIFQQNQIVWAKINGYPWWPAYVKGSVKSNAYEVVFFGDFSRAILHTSKLRQFDELDAQANSKNKVLSVALRSAEKIISGESTILDEWNKIDKSALAKSQAPAKPTPKKPTKKSQSAQDNESLCLSNASRAKCQELDTKVESEEQTEFKCGNSVHNNITSSTYNHFMDNREPGDELAYIEERLEDLAAALRSDEYKSEAGVRTVHEVTGRATALEPKVVFASNVGVLMSNCITVCRARLPLRPYRLTLELLTDSLAKICDFLIKDGFLMEQQVRADYIDLSKRNSIITEYYPDLTSPGLFEANISPVSKQRVEPELALEVTLERAAERDASVEVEARVQFRVKRKLAKMLYREENKEKIKKKLCEELATQLESSIRSKARCIADYKEEVLALVKMLEKSRERFSDVVCGFANGKKIDAMINEINKLTGC